ncbi:21426_t:CDS:2, partial [Cetraspora pellucida]
MVHKKQPPKQEQSTYSPYYYPNFSRYNYPSKIGDEEVYTEPKFSFPHWDDEVSGYTPLRRRASFPSGYGNTEEYINNKDLNELINTTSSTKNQELTEIEQEDEGEVTCDQIQTDIELARRDQKTDYEQFRKAHATLHDDIRALQQEIEKFEAVCMSSGWNSTKDRDVRQSEPTSTVTGSLMAAAVFNGPGRTLASQSATAAARGQRQRKTRHNRAESFSVSSVSGSKPTRCIGAEDVNEVNELNDAQILTKRNLSVN